MEMLTSTVLASNFWRVIINSFANWIGNYGWAIIVFAIVLKLIMSPLDILQRVSSAKQSRMMSAMQPELDEIKRKYANNPERLNQEQNKLNKKYNSNMGGMCLTMVLTLGISLAVFFTLYGSIRSYGNDKLYETYNSLDQVYVQADKDIQDDVALGNTWSDEEIDEYISKKVQDQYSAQKKQNSWLWVKNVWKSDTKTSQFVDFEAYADHYNLTGADREAAKTRYNSIVNTIAPDGNVRNGYYGLIIACGVLTLLSQFISSKLLNKKGQKMNIMNIIMMIAIPISMIIFASTSNAMFTLYIIANSLSTTIISTIISLIINHRNKGKTDEEILAPKRKVEVVEYSRNYKK